ncbi:hypothetical protein Esti_001351 [Eimeria stiedai]
MVSTSEGRDGKGPAQEGQQGAPPPPAASPAAAGAAAPAATAAAAADWTAERKREALTSEGGLAEKKPRVRDAAEGPSPPLPGAPVPMEALGPLGPPPLPTGGPHMVVSSASDREAPQPRQGNSQDPLQQQQQIGDKPMIAPGVVRLAPLERNIHSCVALSRPSLHAESIPPQDFEARMQAAHAAAMGGPPGAQGAPRAGGGGPRAPSDGLLPDSAADRPPVLLDEQKLKEREDAARAEAAKAAAEKSRFPSCSSWFDSSTVSPLEQDMLPTLFSGSSVAPEEQVRVYRQLRNSIMGHYQANPLKHLAFTDCRQLIPGDAALLLRVYSFLDYWGLINFQADPATVPSSVRRKREFLMKDMQGWSRANLYEKLQQRGSAAAAAAGAAAETSAAPQGQGPWRCVACGKLCLYSYYVLRPGGTAGVSLGVMDNCVWCIRCHADGRYPHVLTGRNFVKVDLLIAGSTGESSDWQLDETERLIEAIELHRDDWEEVAEHVGGGRTPQQCVERFIQLPTHEPFLVASEKVLSGTENTPFSSFANPLLSLLALLSSVVHPAVAAAAAQAALQKAVELGTPASHLSPQKQETPASSSSSSRRREASTDAAAAAAEARANGVSQGEVKEEPRAPAPVSSSSSSSGSSSSSKELLLGEEALQVAAATALAAGAASAAEMQEIERQNIGLLLRSLLEVELRRIDIKLQKLQAVEDAVARSKQQMENKLAQLFTEHADIAAELDSARRLGPAASLS